jgi:hypothetical protein
MMPAPALPTTAVVERLEEVWGISRQPAGCSHCHQVHLVDASGLGRVCPSCVRGKLEAQPALLRPEPPELLIPFRISREEIARILKQYSEAVWIRPDDFKAEILMSRLMPVYFPEWLVDSDILGTWSAEMGYDYKVKSSEETYSSGGWHTREVIETRIRWEPRMGQIAKRFDNIQVPALEDHRHLIRVTGGYQTQQPIPYNPDRLGQAYLRVPDLPPESAWPVAQDNLDQAAALSCTQAAGAQHVRNFDLHADYESLNWTQLLLPTYVTYYTDDQGLAHPVYINGQSGAAGGIRLASQRKGWIWAGVLLLIALVLFLSGILSFVAATLMPPLGVLGTFLIVLGLVVGVAAIIPAIWPWRWNREQQAAKVTRT